MNDYDIFGVLETKLDDFDIVSLNGYTLLGQTRRQKCLRKSGGVGAFIKIDLCNFVTVLETSSDVMWLKLCKKGISVADDIILGIVYQPPENSKYYTDNENEQLEVEITATCISYKYVYLLGDMNARTKEMDDFIEADTFCQTILSLMTMS